MKRWGRVHGGVVYDTVLQDSMPTIEGEWVEITQDAGPGDLWEKGRAVKPPQKQKNKPENGGQ